MANVSSTSRNNGGNVSYNVRVDIPGLKALPKYLQKDLRDAAYHIGDRLQVLVRQKQRIDRGQERNRTQYKVTKLGEIGFRLSVFNTVVQALVDEFGRKPGSKMPPYKIGTPLYRWILRKGIARGGSSKAGRSYASKLGDFIGAEARRSGLSRKEAAEARRGAIRESIEDEDKNAESVAFLIARSIGRRGLPRPGDPLRAPMKTTRNESLNMIETVVNFATLKSVKRANDELNKFGQSKAAEFQNVQRGL